MLCEIADDIKKSPDQYRHLFTTSSSDKKTELYIFVVDPNKIDLNETINEIAAHSPIDPKYFSATFSTSTVESRLACQVMTLEFQSRPHILTRDVQAAFCEAMNIYYAYNCFMCGIPRVRVLGENVFSF